jgi:glutaminase
VVVALIADQNQTFDLVRPRPALAWSPVQRYLENLHAECAADRSGSLASYIPELARANPDDFGICIATVDGCVYEVGDTRREFTIQSMSKPFTYGIALEDQGRQRVFDKIGIEPSGEAFNSISLEADTGRPLNPMINAGAITAASLVAGESLERRLERVLDVYGRCAGRELAIDRQTFESELSSGHRNRAIGHMLRTFGILVDDPEAALELYFRQCSVSVDCRDVSMMAATLANSGVHPLTRECALEPESVETMLSVMTTCGMYDGAGDWVEGVGMPAKSGVSGGILAVLPGQLGICVYSPLLDSRGNSARGVEVCRRLSRDLHLHFLFVARSSRGAIRAEYDIASVPSKRIRTRADRDALLSRGRRVRVYELQGDLLFSGCERLVRAIVEHSEDLEAVIIDLRAVSLLSDAAKSMLGSLGVALNEQGKQLAFVDCGRRSSYLPSAADEVGSGSTRQRVFGNRDEATEWAEDLLLAEDSNSHEVVELAECQLCRGLSGDHLALLASLLERRSLLPGELAVRAGDPAEAIFILVAGEVSVTIDLESGRRRLVTIIPGATFGELAVVDQATRTADVRADRASEVLVLRSSTFEEVGRSCPELQSALLRNLLRGAYEIIERSTRELSSLASW